MHASRPTTPISLSDHVIASGRPKCATGRHAKVSNRFVHEELLFQTRAPATAGGSARAQLFRMAQRRAVARCKLTQYFDRRLSVRTLGRCGGLVCLNRVFPLISGCVSAVYKYACTHLCVMSGLSTTRPRETKSIARGKQPGPYCE
jgi:hypothetical protein